MTAFFTSVPNWIQDAKQEEETGWKLVPRPKGRESENSGKCQYELSGASFASVDKLRANPEQRPYCCPQLHCGKAFASKYKLYRYASVLVAICLDKAPKASSSLFVLKHNVPYPQEASAAHGDLKSWLPYFLGCVIQAVL